MENGLPSRIAVHEAGHAMLWSAEIPTPSTLELVYQPEEKGKEGYVTNGRPKKSPEEMTDKRLIFGMLVKLAGQAAEQMIFDAPSEMAGHDNKEWVEYAREFIGRHSEVGWTEEHLHESQMLLLSLFFRMNREVTVTLARAAESQGRVNVAEFLTTAGHVNYLEEPIFPRPAAND